jgi:hypothetical protein
VLYVSDTKTQLAVQEKKPAYLKWLQTKTKDHILFRPKAAKAT